MPGPSFGKCRCGGEFEVAGRGVPSQLWTCADGGLSWWCGISRRQAAQCFSAVKTTAIGQNLVLLEDQRHAFESIEMMDDDVVDLLPKWDPYTMGYAPDGRQRLVHDEHLSKAYTTGTTRQG